MKVYIIIKNNEGEYGNYKEWIEEVYENKKRAENRFIELVKTNYHKKDREVNLQKYYRNLKEFGTINIGSYRLETHEVIKEREEK